MKSDEFSGRCWMITSRFSVIAILIITGICFGVFVYPYMKRKGEAALVSIVYIGIMSVLYLIPRSRLANFLHICWELWLHFL